MRRPVVRGRTITPIIHCPRSPETYPTFSVESVGLAAPGRPRVRPDKPPACASTLIKLFATISSRSRGGGELIDGDWTSFGKKFSRLVYMVYIISRKRGNFNPKNEKSLKDRLRNYEIVREIDLDR